MRVTVLQDKRILSSAVGAGFVILAEFSVQDAIADYGPPVARAAVVLVATWLIARLVVRLSDRAPEAYQRQLKYGLPKVVWTIGLLILLSSLGINVNSLLAVLGIIGIAGALIFTPVGQNMIAGFLAGMDDVVAVGDVITVQDRVGTITRKGTLSLSVEMPDGSVIYVPNTQVVDDELTNHNRVKGARIDVEIKLDGSPDKRRAVEIMHATLDTLEWRSSDREPMVHFTEIGSSAFHYRCYVWVEKRLSEPQRKSDMLTALVYALEDEGFSVGETSNVSASDFSATFDAPSGAAAGQDADPGIDLVDPTGVDP
ncbi:MAG: mechanosensitive ion channel family protein [Acidimicrobiales bacterium]